MALNTFCGVGRLTRDPEVKTTASGTSVCHFSLAIQRTYVPKGGERKTDFIPCTAWGKTAEFLKSYFHKGNSVAVEGNLQQETYKDKDGNNREKLDVNVTAIHFVESNASNASNTSSNTSSALDYTEVMDDVDLPFE